MNHPNSNVVDLAAYRARAEKTGAPEPQWARPPRPQALTTLRILHRRRMLAHLLRQRCADRRDAR
jgi:hypothetical protein